MNFTDPNLNHINGDPASDFIKMYTLTCSLSLTEETVSKSAICQRKGCGKAKVDVADEEDTCEHHPGSPIFHEGLYTYT